MPPEENEQQECPSEFWADVPGDQVRGTCELSAGHEGNHKATICWDRWGE